MTLSRSNSLRLIAFLLTMAILFGQGYLPQKSLEIHPNKNNLFELYSDEPNGGKSKVEWLNEKQRHWKCTLIESDTYPVCGLSIIFSQKPYKTINFTDYTHIRYRLSYQGDASKIRFFLRSYSPEYATLLELEPAKFQSVVIRTADISSTVDVQLSEFSVADWWKDEYDIPREHSQPDFDAVVAIGIDQAAPLAYGEHIYELESVELVGDWISKESLYLGIIISWMLLLGWEAISRMLYWYHYVKRSTARLDEARLESQKYKELVNIDPLTGLLNRHGLNKVMNEMGENRQALHDFSVLVLDIDHFKLVNDQYGHNLGDNILEKFAQMLSMSVRDDDVPVRWGGEEFVLLLHTNNPTKALAVSENIRKKIAATQLCSHPPISITTSIGVAIPAEGERFKDVFHRADTALYNAKNNGRNRVEIGY